jgi:hypothetical protein
MLITEAARIFRAHNGDKKAQELVTVEQLQEYIPAPTFERFLEINRIEAIEEVTR